MTKTLNHMLVAFNSTNKSEIIEHYLLFLSAFFLPLYEAPKNLFLVCYFLLFCINRGQQLFAIKWRGINILMLFWLLTVFIVCALPSSEPAAKWAWVDSVRLALLFFCLQHSKYSAQIYFTLIKYLIAGVVIALSFGLYQYLWQKNAVYLQLHSVGHVNHSALYLALCLLLVSSCLISFWQMLRWQIIVTLFTIIVYLTLGLFYTDSRAAVGAALVSLVFLSFLMGGKIPYLRLSILSLIFAILAVNIALDTSIVKKQKLLNSQGEHLSNRGPHWNRALVAWQNHPWLGVGMDNYKYINEQEIAETVTKSGKIYRPQDYKGSSHAHNWYLNTLAERGIIGALGLYAFILTIVYLLWRDRPSMSDDSLKLSFWASALAAWLIMFLSGMFTTSFHHENGSLTMLLTGAWFSLQQSNWQNASK